MESRHARSRLRFGLFTLSFFSALGGAAWYMISGGRPAEPGGIVSEEAAPPPAASAGDTMPHGVPVPSPSAIPSEGPSPGAGLAIEGSVYFKRQVTRSLKLIWTYDREAFDFIRKYVYVVRSAGKTAFGMHAGVPTVFISEINTYKSDAWCAGIIAHHAWHSYYRSASNAAAKRRPAPPPPGEKAEWIAEKVPNPLEFDITTLRDITAQEKKADEFQLRVLGAVGASRAEISLVRRRDPRDLSVSHDGSYSSKP
ncbi:MAG: hypothetical protein FD189_297 [Elusimicrobia bacterium]|nr:MAG: hypothetical protein FD154_97 [Elusimicrobiota bacterium]KAF0158030.1 MAG: hypothetical protein FD189_297 [Elusimicrobiota bacterium]